MKMEFSLSSFDGALPVEVTIDEDNGRYMIRKSDRSGEYFNSPNRINPMGESTFPRRRLLPSRRIQRNACIN